MKNLINLKEIFENNFKNDFIIKYDGTKVTYKEFWEKTECYINKLHVIGCARNDFILIKLENSIDVLQLYLACMNTGIIACPVDPLLKDEKISLILENIKPKLVINDLDILNNIKTIDPINNNYNKENLFLNFIMLFTSGTTGNPKGILHTGNSLLNSAYSFSKLSGMNTETVVYHHLPMFYMAGIFNLFLCPLLSGAKIILGKRFSSEQMLKFWKIPKKYGVNNLTLTPTMAYALIKTYRDDKNTMNYIKNINSVICTGSYLYEAIYNNFMDKFGIPLQSCYGVTEVGGTITYSKKYDKSVKYSESVGAFGENTKILCDGKKNKPCEILIKTPFMMSGYFNKGNVIDSFENGYFRTGDIGYIENGKLFITGRTGDYFKKGGEFISLSMIENVMIKSELAQEITVVNVDDEFWGNKILLFYVNNQKKSKLIEKQIMNYAINNLSKIEIPDHFVKVEQIPKTSIGKIKKNILIKNFKNKILK